MEEINLVELLKFITSKLAFIVIITLLSLLLGFVYVTFILTPMYHSTTTLILVDKVNTAQNVTMNKNLVSSYSEIVKSRSVLTKVINKTETSKISKSELNDKINNLSNRITVSSVENAPIIKIQVSDKDNKKAQEIANVTAETFIEKVHETFGLTNIKVVDKGNLEYKPYNIRAFKRLFIITFLGFTISLIIIFLKFYFDTTIKSFRDIEEKIGLPVIGNITMVKNKGDK